MKLLPRRLIVIGLIMLGFAVAFATPAASLEGTASSGQAITRPNEQPPNWEQISSMAAEPVRTVSGENLPSLPPPAERDPCLHCHIAGEIFNEWMPISRWFVFGAMGLTFIFGVTRNFIVWQTRKQWHLYWMNPLSRITALFFLIQASAGIVLLLLRNTTPEIIVQIVSIVKVIHWGSGIVLFIAALGVSLAGALRPWYQRPFWTMIFLTTLLGGALAIANLSFAYLYAEWHTPPSPSHLYTLHMLLIPVAIAGLLSIYFIVLRKRGETS
jgi:hypothetical protein